MMAGGEGWGGIRFGVPASPVNGPFSGSSDTVEEGSLEDIRPGQMGEVGPGTR